MRNDSIVYFETRFDEISLHTRWENPKKTINEILKEYKLMNNKNDKYYDSDEQLEFNRHFITYWPLIGLDLEMEGYTKIK